jgi:hypothetical protein
MASGTLKEFHDHSDDHDSRCLGRSLAANSSVNEPSMNWSIVLPLRIISASEPKGAGDWKFKMLHK